MSESGLRFSERRKVFLPVFYSKVLYKLLFQMQTTFSVSTDLLGFNCRKYHLNVSYTTVVLLKFNLELDCLHNKLIRTILIGDPESKKHYIINNSYKIYYVEWPWFLFWLVFDPYTTQAVFLAWMRPWVTNYHLGLPLVIVHWKATIWKRL